MKRLRMLMMVFLIVGLAGQQRAVSGTAGAEVAQLVVRGHSMVAALLPEPAASPATSYPSITIRVLHQGVPVAGAQVVHLPLGVESAEPLPFTTNSGGYITLFNVADGDRIVALECFTETQDYELYYTSAPVTPSGMMAHTITGSSPVSLTLSDDNVLMLLKLDVSLEWDVGYDPGYLAGLGRDVAIASAELFDWSNGRLGIGKVTIRDQRAGWNTADVRIYASNRVRPNANQGGTVATEIADPQHPEISFMPGQIRMGATWNRYGDPSGNLAKDWPRTLAHEIGHYALFLDDHYLGRTPEGYVVPIWSCVGSAMADPYEDVGTEFLAPDGWLPGCADTLAEHETGRSDWETISLFYPQLQYEGFNPGPALMHVQMTDVTTILSSSDAMAAPFLSVVTEEGLRYEYEASSDALSIMFPTYDGETPNASDQHIREVGLPVSGLLNVRGAEFGDEICMYDPSHASYGCTLMSGGADELTMRTFPGWSPDVVITPLLSDTVRIELRNAPAGLLIDAHVYPTDGGSQESVAMQAEAYGYSAVVELSEPTFHAYVSIEVDEPLPNRGLLMDYTMGGNPDLIKGGHMKIKGGHMKIKGTPVAAADGEIVLYADNESFGMEELLIAQTVTSPPSPPSWATPVGRAFRITTSPNAPDLSEAQIVFHYLESEVPAGQEQWTRIYHWDGVEWQQLATSGSVAYKHLAAGPAAGSGIYMLMSSIELALPAEGWNLFAYPLTETQPVSEFLSTAADFYTLVYGYEPTSSDRWRLYAPDAPAWVSDLTELRFGRGYWINVTEPITLHVSGPMVSPKAGVPMPPSTFYGQVSGDGVWVPSAGMSVTAKIGSLTCGTATTRLVNGQVVYAIDVIGEAERAGCGHLDSPISFIVDGHTFAQQGHWDNGRLAELDLSLANPGDGPAVFLPLLQR